MGSELLGGVFPCLIVNYVRRMIAHCFSLLYGGRGRTSGFCRFDSRSRRGCRLLVVDVLPFSELRSAGGDVVIDSASGRE